MHLTNFSLNKHNEDFVFDSEGNHMIFLIL
jgi:hypothetical protein